MRSKVIYLCILILTAFMIGCGAEKEEVIKLSGALEIKPGNATINPDSPIFVAVSKTMDIVKIENDPLESIVDLGLVTPTYNAASGETEYNYSMDLSGKGVKSGSKVYIFAFIDEGYTGGFPSLDEGDLLGFYIEKDTFNMTYALKEGQNTGVNISISRLVYDFDASVSGTVHSEEAGDIIMVAYTGTIDTFDFTDVDIDDVIGFNTVEGKKGETAFTLNILPYGYDVPIEGVYIFAFLDRNRNGYPDAGDGWGTVLDAEGYPMTLTINEGNLSGLDISIDYQMTEPSGYEITLEGSFEAPSGYDTSPSPAFIIVCEADNPEAIFEDTIGTVKTFVRVDSPEKTFTVDLSSTDLVPGDNVMIIGLWDLDYDTGLPNVSENDILGYYIDPLTYSYQYELQNGANTGITLSLDYTYEENSAVVEGSILGDQSGDVIVVAYNGEIESMDINIDPAHIIGYKEITKGAGTAPYSMGILPLVSVPVDDVYILAFLDNNGNGTPDGGDVWGSYSDGSGYPITTTVPNGTITGFDITLDHPISEPSGYTMSIEGSFGAPTGYNAGSPPVFIIVCSADNPEEIFEDTMSTVKTFTKLDPGQTTFNVDLSNTDLLPGEEVMIIGLWDLDYESGLPVLTEGDIVGYYIDQDTFNYQYELQNGVNSGITLSLGQTYEENSAVVQGSILGDESGDVILIAYNGEINSMDMEIDTDHIIGYETFTKGSGAAAYSMDILPFVTMPADNVYILAVFDDNGNGTPDDGDKIGFYTDNDMGIPSLITVNNNTITGIDIAFTMDYMEPAAGGSTLTLSGSIQAPSGYSTDPSTDPIFIIVATADNTFDIFSDPVGTMKYFVKLPQGETEYNIDLSSTGLSPGDEIRIMALWDRNYQGGFPYPDAGDKIGYYQNKSDFSFSMVLVPGSNYANRTNGWSFNVDKTLYDHEAQIRFQITRGDLSVSAVSGNDVVIIVVHENGVDNEWNWWKIWDLAPSYAITDMDYIMGIDYVDNVTLGQYYTRSIFPFLYDNITGGDANPFPIDTVYVYAILDSNHNGWPDDGEYIGYYSKFFLFQYIPDTCGPIINGTFDVGTVRFSNRQYE